MAQSAGSIAPAVRAPESARNSRLFILLPDRYTHGGPDNRYPSALRVTPAEMLRWSPIRRQDLPWACPDKCGWLCRRTQRRQIPFVSADASQPCERGLHYCLCPASRGHLEAGLPALHRCSRSTIRIDARPDMISARATAPAMEELARNGQHDRTDSDSSKRHPAIPIPPYGLPFRSGSDQHSLPASGRWLPDASSPSVRGGSMNRVALRLLSAIPTLFGVILVTFLLTRVLPGDPAVFFASNPSMSAADVEAVRQHLGLDLPLAQQFWIYLTNIVQGDLGKSLATGQTVVAELARRLPASAELTLFAFFLAIMAALPLGVMAALRPGSLLDHAARLIATLGVSMPTFVTGLLLIFLFYFLIGWAPEPIGRLDPFMFEPPRITGFLTIDAILAGDWAVFPAALNQMLLPAISITIFTMASLSRMARASMLEVLGSEFIRTARALGLPRRKIILTYAFRNAMVPVITTMGMTFSYTLGANVLVEQVFSWPGIGAFAISSIINLDYAPLQGFMLMMAFIFIAVNLLTDIATALIDPRAPL